VPIPRGPHGDDSEGALAEAVRAGAAVISEPVFAELAAHFPDRTAPDRFLPDARLTTPTAVNLWRRACVVVS
jgi:hypothetical protein